MIVHKVFRQDDSGRKQMEAALKKFFYPQLRAPDEQQTVRRPQEETAEKDTGKDLKKP